jgi:PAS domain S-box-containing protein
LTLIDATAHPLRTGGLNAFGAFLHTLAHQVSVGIFLTDSLGRCLYVNPHLCSLMDLHPSEISGREWLHAVHPQDHDRVVGEWNRATQERLTFMDECRLQRSDKSIRWVMVEAFPLRTGQDDVTGYLGAIRDVTASKLALEALQASEGRYRTLLDAFPRALFVHADGQLLFSNPAGARLLGAASTQELAGRKLTNWFAADALEMLSFQAGRPAASTGRTLRKSDGTAFDVEVYVAPITYNGAAAVLFTLSDPIPQKEMTAHRDHARKIEAIAALSGGIAHEFNNCLTAILGFTELALLGVPTDGKCYGHLQQVMLASKRARELVGQMLTFSRQADTAKQPIAPHFLLKETLRLFRMGLPDTITVHETIQASTRRLLADPTQVHQVFVNLLAYAQQSLMAAEGILEIRLEDIGVGTNSVGSSLQLAPGDYICLTVSNSVQETAAETQTDVTGPILPAAGVGESPGIVLAVANGIVAELGGTIRVTTLPRHGVAVEVFFPVLTEPELNDSLAKVSGER